MTNVFVSSRLLGIIVVRIPTCLEKQEGDESLHL